MALDRLMEAKFEAMSARLESHNEFRAQINKERLDYVTRKEVGWLVATFLALLGLVIAALLPRA